MQYAEPPRRVFHFRWIFPLGQLVFSIFLVSIVVELRHYIPYVYAARVSEAITAMNLPGVLIQLPVALLFPDHEIWRPPGMSVQLWHGITYPIFGMVFWWTAGRATEALVAIDYRQLVPKIGWMETVTGFLLMAGGATILGGMLFDLSSSGWDWETTRLAAGGGLWALLGALSVVARFPPMAIQEKAECRHLRDRLKPGFRMTLQHYSVGARISDDGDVVRSRRCRRSTSQSNLSVLPVSLGLSIT